MGRIDMEPTAGESPAKRDGHGRFAPGQSGNPAGKKPGTRNRATRVREVAAEGDEAVVLQALMELVRAGNAAAVRLAATLFFAKPRDREIDLELPSGEAGATPAAIFDRVFRMMARGELTIDEASRIGRLIEQWRGHARAASGAGERPAGKRATPPAGAAAPASDLHPAGRAAGEAAPPAAPPRPLNRHERRRAAALKRGARAPTPLTVVA
jgi:hypothetical protein